MQTLLDAAAGSIKAEVSRVAACCYGIEVDDLRSIAAMAVLEAHLTYAQGASASPKTWTRRVLRWRLDEAARRSERPETPTADMDAVLNGRSPERAMLTAERMIWLQSAVSTLPPRRAAIVVATLHGEKPGEIAETLGIKSASLQVEKTRTVKCLANMARIAGLGENDDAR